MGFEQLAALKEQLAKQAAAAPRAKTRRAPPKASASAPKPAQPGKQPARAAKPDRPARPVDPVLQAIAKLQKRFPQTFPKNPAPKVPLKIGLFEDLVQHAQELGLTEPELRDAIRTWCRGTRYWTCLVEGAPRLDLAGQETGRVAQADANRAQGLQARRAARTAPQPAAQPAPQPAAEPAAEPKPE